jgi:hypothetical protein
MAPFIQLKKLEVGFYAFLAKLCRVSVIIKRPSMRKQVQGAINRTILLWGFMILMIDLFLVLLDPGNQDLWRE